MKESHVLHDIQPKALEYGATESGFIEYSYRGDADAVSSPPTGELEPTHRLC